MTNTLKIMALCTVYFAFLMGCSTTRIITHSPRATIEQLLISAAVDRSLPSKFNKSLPIPVGSKIILNTSGLTEDTTLLQQELNGWFGKQGYLVQNNEENATYRIDVIVRALGTATGGTFFGIPPVSSQLIPFSLPEMAFYKSQLQTGYVKFNMNIFEALTGKFIGSSPTFLADSFFDNYTIFFLFTYTSTDLTSPPQLGSYGRTSLGPKKIRPESYIEIIPQ